MKPTCATCSAFEPTAGNPKSGLCRAAPPIGIPVMGQVSALSQQMVPCIQGGWPPTQAGFWCRSWLPAGGYEVVTTEEFYRINVEDQADGRQS